MGSRGAGRELPHGGVWQLVLAGPVRCPGGVPRFAPPGGVLRVRAQTGAGERSADLTVPPAVLQELQGTAERACGVVPAAEAVQIQEVGTYQETGPTAADSRLTLDLQVLVASSAPVDVLQVESAPGLRVALRLADRPAVFPFRLESPGPWPRVDGEQLMPTPLQAVLTVADCADARTGGVTRQVGGPLLQLDIEVQGLAERGVAAVYDSGGVSHLVEDAC